MSKAIDIVLIPDEPLLSLSLQLNARAFATGHASAQLNLHDRLPHLSLLMGVMADEHKNKIIVELEKIADSIYAIPLEFKELSDYSLNFINSNELQKLHETIVKTIDPLLTHKTSPEMFAEEPSTTLDPGIFTWVEEFPTRYSFEAFYPHITIGHAPDTATIIPPRSTAATLALCHLGNFNTCRTILWSTKLINNSL